MTLSVSLLGVCLAQRRSIPQGFQQEYDEPEKQSTPQHQEQQRPRELTTPIPIIRFDKEQGNDGSYKTL